MKTIILIGLMIAFTLVLVGFQKSNNLKDKTDNTLDINQKDLSEATFAGLLQQYMMGQVKQPFHYQARQQAGFNDIEMEMLEKLAGRHSSS